MILTAILAIIIGNGLSIASQNSQKHSTPISAQGTVPYATFSFLLTNDTVKVDSQSYGDDTPLRLDWDFGDGTYILNGSDKETHIYAQNGTYIIRLNVTDSNGDTDFMQKNATVKITVYGDGVIVIDGYTHIFGPILLFGVIYIFKINTRRKRII